MADESTAAEIAAPVVKPGTAAAKIEQTLRELSKPDPGAGGLELTLASVAMGLEQGIGADLAGYQESGELDTFVTALTRWFATLRSDAGPMLVVVELPRHEIPPAARLHNLDTARAEADAAQMPL